MYTKTRIYIRMYTYICIRVNVYACIHVCTGIHVYARIRRALPCRQARQGNGEGGSPVDTKPSVHATARSSTDTRTAGDPTHPCQAQMQRRFSLIPTSFSLIKVT